METRMHHGEMCIGKWRVEPCSGQLRANDERARVKPKVMELLAHFAQHPGQVLSKEHLLETLWNGTFVTENTLMNAVSELRKALGDNSKRPAFIETLPRRGYRLIAPVNQTPAPEPDPRSPASMAKRFAVLPFEDLDANSQQHPAATLSVLVADALARDPRLRVISRASCLACKRARIPLPEIVRQLAVERILEGSLLRLTDTFELVVRLYDQQDDHLWSDAFTVAVAADLVALKELAGRIAEAVARSELGA